jgi:Helix-turn-helix domain
MADPKIVTDARERLGTRLAMLRQAAGYTQEAFAPKTLYGRSTIANVERGRQSVQRDFWTRCDDVLQTGGVLAAEHDLIEQLRAQHRRELALTSQGRATDLPPVATLPVPRQRPTSSVLCGVADLEFTPGSPLRAEQILATPSGRFFTGADVDVRLHRAISDTSRVLAQVPEAYAKDPFIVRSRRGLVVGVAEEPTGVRMFGLDNRYARRRLTASAAGARLLIPRAYALDEITLGVLWAVANLDDALLDDDRLIAEYQQHLEHYEGQPRSAASRASATELASISAMWLGSDFCARHILRHINQVKDIPVFWTREQRGEEASSWLLFAHKYNYLAQLASRFPDGMTRTFCIPEATVIDSPLAERVLLLLVLALMESFDIRSHVTIEPEYAAVDGFALDGSRQAIVANWVGADGIWSVDITSSRSAVREYADANSYVRTHAVAPGVTPAERLRAFADFLGLDWNKIINRCADLATYGLAGIAEPRSRLLSLDGVDRACRYLGDLRQQAG